ncbi:MAG: phenylalanine--tRNA ligase subunit alpha [candidate division Zixibacteria bacterium]|nr:phenylalanine--tRNA ligase subunit alpha [candidate division Zixibacteria bacterium]
MPNAEDIASELRDLEALAQREWSGANPAERLGLKSRYLGKKSPLNAILRGLKDLPDAERRTIGGLANETRDRLTALFEAAESSRASVAATPYDYTLPGRPHPRGHGHILSQTMDEVIAIFYGMGFEVAEGPEIETDYYNFAALNFPPDHPARDMQDTFFLNDEHLLRTHTSPVQIRVMESQRPPVRILAPGRVYRNEAINARSYCVFHQVEGLYVDSDVSFADLKGVLVAFASEYFGPLVTLRFRPSFFPFTEPSTEVDISCLLCRGRGCSLCKHEGWLEILGAGMVHPAVFAAVDYDVNVFSGYAFGMGIERIAMLKHGIDDIRLFYENDLRFLRQF